MDIKSLYTLIAIAENGSFADAAAIQKVSVSTVSLQVAAIEREAGKSLFDRSTRPTTITPSGRTFVLQAREVIAQWEKLQGNSTTALLQGAIKIGAVHTVVASTLPQALSTLQKKEPELTVKLVSGLTDELIDKVSRHSLDCAFVTVPDYLPPNIDCFEITSEPLVVIAHENALEKTAASLLQNNNYVRFSPDAQVARIVDELLRERKINTSPRMEIDTLEAVFSLVSHGLGVSIVPHAGDSSRLPPHVRCFHFAKPAVTRQIGLILHKDSKATGIIEQLMILMRQQ